MYDIIEKAAKARGVTMEDVASAVGMSSAYPEQWKKMKRASFENKCKIAYYLDVSICYLDGWNPDDYNEKCEDKIFGNYQGHQTYDFPTAKEISKGMTSVKISEGDQNTMGDTHKTPKKTSTTEPFYNRLKRICKERNVAISKMLTDLGISTGNTGSWGRGVLPNGENLISISEYLNISIDYLLLGYEYNSISDTERGLLKEIRKTKNKEDLINLLKSYVIYERSKTL